MPGYRRWIATWPLMLCAAMVTGAWAIAGEAPENPREGDGDEKASQVRGRIVSTQYEKMDGSIERAIVAAWKLPERERVLLEGFAGEEIEIELPPGRYRLDFSAVGSRGATFDGQAREVTLGPGRKPRDLGTIDLPISRTTSLYGRPAPDLEGIIDWKDTEPLALAELRGKVVVLDFFGYYCSICHAHKPDLARLYRQYGGKGLVVIALHDDSVATLQEMNEKMDPILRRAFDGEVPRLPMALDGAGEKNTFAAYGIRAVPAVILIDPKGRVVRRYHHAGVPELERDVRRLLRTRPASREKNPVATGAKG